MAAEVTIALFAIAAGLLIVALVLAGIADQIRRWRKGDRS